MHTAVDSFTSRYNLFSFLRHHGYRAITLKMPFKATKEIEENFEERSTFKMPSHYLGEKKKLSHSHFGQKYEKM